MRKGLTASGLVALAMCASAHAALPDVPVLSREVPAGSVSHRTTAPVSSLPARKVDGSISDWVGTSPRFAGATLYSAGELIYQDHLFDAYGPDDGRDAQRMRALDPLAGVVPETYRLDAAEQADIPGQFGFETPAALAASSHYGDLPRQDAADLEELRLAADPSSLWLLARTTTMTSADQTALLVLLDTRPGSARYEVPWGSGIHTDRAEVALLLAGNRGWAASLRTGKVVELPSGSVATNPDGYVNAIEARIPRALIGRASRVGVAAATGPYDGAANAIRPANVAFRAHEPVRNWFDKRQALALHAGSIDEFFASASLGAMAGGRNEQPLLGPGYYERVFVSSERISREGGEDGVFQHYGVYLPTSYDGSRRLPLQLWLHWRGGDAQAAAALTPRVFKHFGEDEDTIVVSPRGRGSSTWYVGRGQADLLEVWDDVHRMFKVDSRRTYLSGHSMGGWGSYLMSILYPDRFAAAMPVAGPVTQGAWTGVDFKGCDSFHFQGDDMTPCYTPANGGDPRVEHTRRLLDNLRNVPIAVYAGVEDELVPFGGVTRQVERLVELGYRHRFYVFPANEHYSNPIQDEWAAGARYMHRFAIDPNPAHVTYIRDMPFEHAVETVQSDGVAFDFDFNHAYWMSELEPVDDHAGAAHFDGRSLAIPERSTLSVPEAGGPASSGNLTPYAMTGLAWRADPTKTTPASRNAFEATLTGASRVRLALRRMRIDPSRRIEGTVTTDSPLTLRLAGGFSSVPRVTVNGAPGSATVTEGVLTVELPAGKSRLVVG